MFSSFYDSLNLFLSVYRFHAQIAISLWSKAIPSHHSKKPAKLCWGARAGPGDTKRLYYCFRNSLGGKLNRFLKARSKCGSVLKPEAKQISVTGSCVVLSSDFANCSLSS
ncbi:hypothetical protein SAMN05518855_101348 [Paenibacillus sp. CF384]|nr:hypothetical protein SAMN05518855_101348 [Paenibacillus sp. CF384]